MTVRLQHIRTTLGHCIQVLLLLLALFASANCFAKNKFIHIRDGDPIPKNKYIFTLLNIETGETYFGYSKTTPRRVGKLKFVGGIRNGGHVALLQKALGESDMPELLEKIGPVGEGKFASGGFVIDEEGKTVIHRYYSFRANGYAGVDPYVSLLNPRLPGYKESGLIPSEYAKSFLGAIAKRTHSELRLTPTVFDYLDFQSKGRKHYSIERDRVEQTMWAADAIEAINKASSLRKLAEECKGRLK